MIRFIVGTKEKGNLFKDGRSYSNFSTARMIATRKQEFIKGRLIVMKVEVVDELAKLKEENEKLKSLVDDFILDCERCDRYFESSSTRNQFQRRIEFKKKQALGE